MNEITPEQQEILADIFENSERPDKITIGFNVVSKSIHIIYDDLDQEWYEELWEASK